VHQPDSLSNEVLPAGNKPLLHLQHQSNGGLPARAGVIGLQNLWAGSDADSLLRLTVPGNTESFGIQHATTV